MERATKDVPIVAAQVTLPETVEATGRANANTCMAMAKYQAQCKTKKTWQQDWYRSQTAPNYDVMMGLSVDADAETEADDKLTCGQFSPIHRVTNKVQLATSPGDGEVAMFKKMQPNDDGNILADVAPSNDGADVPTNTTASHNRSRNERRNGARKDNMELKMLVWEKNCENDAS